MQVGAINSVNFKANEKFDLDDFEKSINAVRILENKQKKDTVEFSDENENQEPKKKNILELGLSIAGTVIGAFLLSKKAYNKATPKIKEALSKISQSYDLKGVANNFQKLALDPAKGKVKTVIENSKLLNNINEKAKTIINNLTTKDNFVVNKLKDKANVAGVIGAVAGTTYVATTDGNEDGVADIAQKGVNAYRNAIEKLEPLAEAIKVLS